MSIFERLRQKLAASSRYPADYWPSVVVLLAKPIFPAKDEILARAQQAWGNAGQAKLMGTLRDGASHLVQCGPMFFQSIAQIHAMANPANGEMMFFRSHGMIIRRGCLLTFPTCAMSRFISQVILGRCTRYFSYLFFCVGRATVLVFTFLEKV